MPSLDSVTGLPLPLWAAGTLAALFVVVCVMTFRRSGTANSLAALARIAAVVLAAVIAWPLANYSMTQQRAAERQMLDTRASDLIARALVPGLPLACLLAEAGETVEAACEKILFASPESVAAAVFYVDAQLMLLANAPDPTSRTDFGRETKLGGLRRAIEADRFGLVAQVLAARDGCTPEHCEALALLQDAARVTANLKSRKYENNVARYAASWSAPKEAQATAPPPMSPPTVVSATKPIDFPTAASIPPISIMNAEPPLAPPAAAAEAVPPRRAPAATARPAGNGTAAPVQIAPPPTANVANPPRSQ
jgi:hypothetical protein